MANCRKDEDEQASRCYEFLLANTRCFRQVFRAAGCLGSKTNTQVMSGSRLLYRPFGGTKEPAVRKEDYSHGGYHEWKPARPASTSRAQWAGIEPRVPPDAEDVGDRRP